MPLSFITGYFLLMPALAIVLLLFPRNGWLVRIAGWVILILSSIMLYAFLKETEGAA